VTVEEERSKEEDLLLQKKYEKYNKVLEKT
jgi:hypothetical protein